MLAPPLEKTREVHTLQLPMAQPKSPTPGCGGKMNKTEFKQEWTEVFPEFLLLLACFYFWLSTLQLLEMEVHRHYVNLILSSNRSKDLSSARVFQVVKVYWDSKRFKMLLGMQYGALYSHVYQMVALNKRHQLATNASKWRDSGSEVAETFRSSLPETPFSSPVPIHTHHINCSGPLSPKTLVPTACCPPSKYSLGWENAHQKFSSKHFWRHSWLILTVISG